MIKDEEVTQNQKVKGSQAMPITKENTMQWLGDIKLKLGIAPSNLAIQVGRTASNFTKMARRTAPETLTPSAVRLILDHLDQLVETEQAPRMTVASLKDFAETNLLNSENTLPQEVGLATHITTRPPEAFHAGPMDIEVRGTAAGSMEGSIQIDRGGDPVEYVRRPPSLATAKNAFAIYVVGESMVPQHNPGELRYVHPDRPAVAGDSVVIETYNPDTGEKEAFIKQLVRRTGNRIITIQHNPKAEIEFVISASEPPEKTNKYAIHIYKVLSVNELMGY